MPFGEPIDWQSGFVFPGLFPTTMKDFYGGRQQEAMSQALQQQAAGQRAQFYPARNQGRAAALQGFSPSGLPINAFDIEERGGIVLYRVPFHFNLPFPPGAWLGRLIAFFARLVMKTT